MSTTNNTDNTNNTNTDNVPTSTTTAASVEDPTESTHSNDTTTIPTPASEETHPVTELADGDGEEESPTPDSPQDAQDADPQDVQDAQNAQDAGDDAQEEEAPLPPPHICLRKHLGKNIQARLATFPKDALDPLYAPDSTHTSLEDMAVSVERAEREAAPFLDQMHQMERMLAYQSRGLLRQQKKEAEKLLRTQRAKCDSALEGFEELRSEMRQRVITFLDGLNAAERERINAEYHKPLSKGVRRHVVDALQRDDAKKLLRSLYCKEMVEQANHSFHRVDPETKERVPVTLEELMQMGEHHFVKEGGAVGCLEAIRGAYA